MVVVVVTVVEVVTLVLVTVADVATTATMLPTAQVPVADSLSEHMAPFILALHMRVVRCGTASLDNDDLRARWALHHSRLRRHYWLVLHRVPWLSVAYAWLHARLLRNARLDVLGLLLVAHGGCPAHHNRLPNHFTRGMN